MALFPNPERCARNIQAFQRKYPRDVAQLSELWQALSAQQTPDVFENVQPAFIKLLGRWQGYRNQLTKNAGILTELAENNAVLAALTDLICLVQRTSSLSEILERKESIRVLFDFLKYNLLQRHVPARIVTVSKSMLMLSGFSVGFDSKVLQQIKRASPYALAVSGVWPFCLYFDMLEYIASEQQAWETQYARSMQALLPNVQIGQVMDRILWRDP